MGINTKILKKNQGLILILILFVAVGGLLFYRDYSIKADKDRFEQAKASIDKLYSDIVANAGEPANAEKSQSCGRAEFKNSGGPLSCLVRIAFVYAVKDSADATDKYGAVQQAISKYGDIFIKTFSNEAEVYPFSALADDRDDKEIGVSLAEIKSGMGCSIRVVYAHGEDLSHRLSIGGAPEALSGSIACQDGAKAEHYPSTN